MLIVLFNNYPFLSSFVPFENDYGSAIFLLLVSTFLLRLVPKGQERASESTEERP